MHAQINPACTLCIYMFFWNILRKAVQCSWTLLQLKWFLLALSRFFYLVHLQVFCCILTDWHQIFAFLLVPVWTYPYFVAILHTLSPLLVVGHHLWLYKSHLQQDDWDCQLTLRLCSVQEWLNYCNRVRTIMLCAGDIKEPVHEHFWIKESQVLCTSTHTWGPGMGPQTSFSMLRY